MIHSESDNLKYCPICSGNQFVQKQVLTEKLIQEWELSPYEAAAIEKQQGLCCSTCGSNLRSITLAAHILNMFDAKSNFLQFCVSDATINKLKLST